MQYRVYARIVLLLVGLSGPLPFTALQAGDELALNLKRLSDRVLIAWVGNHMQTIDVVGLRTARGLVVIETNLIRSADVRIRQAIEKEFGRSDFKYLINTHYHHDHTSGNQVYADATILGHKTSPAGMAQELTGEGLVKLIEKFRAMARDWREGLAQVEPDSDDYHFLREGVTLFEAAVKEYQDGFTPTYPTVLFEKNLIVDMGDVTLELYSVGGTHTSSDIMVFVPEEGLVAIGDMWPDPMLPYLKKGGDWDLDLILENWGRIVDGGREIKYVNFAHSDMDLSAETFREQYRYLRTLWDGLRELRRQGATIEDAKKRYTIEKDFPYFTERRLLAGKTNIHENNIEAIWEKLAGD
jgi:glyoxylase-like metal-dependent hydrolase (beta-lactamase superfamily II)